MTAQVIDGRAIAAKVRAEVAEGVRTFVSQYGRPPGLDVVIVGEDPASHVYVRNKEKASLEVGMKGRLHQLPQDTPHVQLLALVESLCADPSVDGILVQLPLPASVDERAILDAVIASKDVDGFHPTNAGLLALGRPSLVPCTASGCMRLLSESGVQVAGKRAVVIGRSNIVGKPVAQLLLAAHATVTIAHSRTQDLPELCRQADILIAAVGKAQMVRGDWIKEGAAVLDVGTNRDEHGKACGDVHFAEASLRAGFITPVPRGVGPMTIAHLLENTLRAANSRERLRSQPHNP